MKDSPTPAPWFEGCVSENHGQQIIAGQEDGLQYIVATAHANGDDFRANARLIAAAPQMLDLLDRLAGFAAHYASKSAMQAGGDLLVREAADLIAKVNGNTPPDEA